MIMPDIDFQKIELNLIPKKGEQPVVFYASQYETARPFIAVLKWGDSEFAPGVDCYAEIDIRKNDDNIVVITDDVSIDNNEVSVILPVQAVTCIGKNLGQVKIYAADDQLIAALNFILEVQADPLAGGVTSETAIDNLTQQIEDIAQEVIGEDYYNKTETDALLADKADKSELPDMDDYYTKTQTDTLLNGKADRSDLTDLASKAEVTQAISDEDTALKNWASSNFATPGYVADRYYNKNQVDELIDNIFPTLSASGAIASFKTALNKHLVSVIAASGANNITRCGKNFWNVNLIDGYIYNGRYYQSSNYWCTERNIAVKPNTTYTLQGASGSDGQLCFYDENNVYIPDVTIPARTGTFTTPNNAYFISVYNANSTRNDPKQIELGSEATTYEAYNGQTVPVADATSLTTLSGVNNVFADSGDVTVQYKYMSM